MSILFYENCINLKHNNCFALGIIKFQAIEETVINTIWDNDESINIVHTEVILVEILESSE